MSFADPTCQSPSRWRAAAWAKAGSGTWSWVASAINGWAVSASTLAETLRVHRLRSFWVFVAETYQLPTGTVIEPSGALVRLKHMQLRAGVPEQAELVLQVRQGKPAKARAPVLRQDGDKADVRCILMLRPSGITQSAPEGRRDRTTAEKTYDCNHSWPSKSRGEPLHELPVRGSVLHREPVGVGKRPNAHEFFGVGRINPLER